MKLSISSHISAFIGIVLLLPSILVAQLKFKEQVTRQDIHSGIVCAVVDVNGDYYDDILAFDESKKLWLGINNGSAFFFWEKLDYNSSQALWSIAVADLDRNGMNDIIIGGDFYGIQVFYQNQDGFRRDTIENSQFFSQSSTIYDINNDGLLDFTICDDNAKTRVFENVKGELVNNYSWIDLSKQNVQDEEGNYGCLWSDLDQDGDGDLYISKCSPNAQLRTDPRRINLYYQQQADFKFEEKGASLGIACDDQSWISVSGDINGDGRFDLIVANHYDSSLVYLQNEDGTFNYYSSNSPLNSNSNPFQLALEDWDNDGDLDLLSVGISVELFLNNGEGKFTKEDVGIKNDNFTSLSWGDVNEDGLLDIYASYAGLINNPSIVNDKLWMNHSNKNHWAIFALRGRKSNENGIGAIIKIHLGEKVLVRELQAGTAFGLQKSLNLHFGLGSSTRLDSMFIHWPSGIIDRFFDIPVDQFYLCTEGSCITPRNKIFPKGEVNLCEGEDIELSSYVLYDQLVWNTGEKNDTIKVDKSGTYFFKAVNRNNCPIVSENTTLKIDPEEYPRLSRSGEVILCDGEQIEVSVNGYNNIQWNTNSIENSIRIKRAGSYYATYLGICRDFYTDTLVVKYVKANDYPSIPPDTLKGPGIATLQSDLDNTLWYDDKNLANPLSEGKKFETEFITNDRSFWARSYEKEEYQAVRGGMKSPLYNDPGLPGTFLNPKTYFQTFNNFVIDSISVYTDSVGERIFELGSNKDTVVFQRITHNLKKGLNRIYLGFKCKKGLAYTLGTNSAQNQKLFGYRSPRLFRSNYGFAYPFIIGDLCKITTSEFGDIYYYGMFDWQLKADDHYCFSDWVEVPVHIIITNNKELSEEEIQISYSHNFSKLNIQSKEEILSVKLFDLQGKEILSNKTGSSIQLNLISGIYFVQVQTRSGIFTKKLITH